MKFFSKTTQPRSMASWTARLIFIVFTLLIALLLGFSYQFSSTAVNQEMKRNVRQTSALLQNLIDYRLGIMQSNQNSQTKSETLNNYVGKAQFDQIDDYFSSVDQADLKNMPDFRFISKSQRLSWDDGNSSFFGIDKSHLNTLISSVAYSDSWHFVTLTKQSGDKQLLVRRMPFVNAVSGQVLGKLFIVMVLNDNFSLVDNLKTVSNTQEVVLLTHGKPVASTIQIDKSILAKIKHSEQKAATNDNSFVFNLIKLKIDGVDSPISVYSLQNNQSFLILENNYKISLIFSLFSIVLTAFLAKVLIQKRITSELAALMTYAKIARDERRVAKFNGSMVSEFDHIGNTLEHTFSELLEKEKLFQDLFNFALSPIFVWNEQGVIIRMNPAAEKAFQQDGIYIDNDFQAFQQRVTNHIKMVSTGAVLTGVNIPISDTVYSWNLSPISLDDEIHTIIGQGLDITSLVEAERQSNLARIEAEKSASARADFMAKISHEIRTPLNGILGISQLLRRSASNSEQIEKIDVLCQSGEHLLAVLNDILDFSKIEQGKLKIEKNEFLFASVVNFITNIYSPLCDEKNIRLHVVNHLNADTVLSSDQVRLNQILFNLLSNAVKFTHSGSIDVMFSLECQNEQSDMLMIQIKDTGIGISAENLESIYDPFIQSEKTSIREYGGSGLGLSIVKLLVDMLNGEISIVSEEYVGTQFLLKIPVQKVCDIPNTHINQKNSTVKLFDRSLSMLLVEDNKTNAFIAKALCEKYGLKVEWVLDGPSAIDLLKRKSFDLIMMDNQMPSMDGVEATKIIRQEIGLQVPIFACTADGFKETKLAFLNAGADYVLVKPIKDDSLFAALVYYKQHYINNK
ncbi:LuxQ periplasmic sensor domain-containing protein [Vibrio sp. TH_r3]|uniref:LuxQ periplasmic sensor domain-containing protein n=1 Tax=Vibrio sp. TH_r3 TaxID=3082084 RepID=UPI00295441FE|nr:LuxQ periplasmic sensor domain-containing protein [Vibrio sp. TH_r3]MDV7103445.1 LuxQ periplasmic sensor domain-containing protein [Vibrio sp. TH_r3]